MAADFQTVVRMQAEVWLQLGLCARYWIDRVEHDDTWRFSCEVENQGCLTYVFTGYEAAMGGLPALRQWLRVLEQSLLDRVERLARRSSRREHAYDDLAGTAFALHCTMSTIALDGFTQSRPLWTGIEEGRAIQLFKATAGEACYNALESGGRWPMNGSAGGKYWLTKRHSFCVEERVDASKPAKARPPAPRARRDRWWEIVPRPTRERRARLGPFADLPRRYCAVVPGVPLWDHLLGIKLMVENDEPKFLATANVS